jgi:hypothetical protein
MYKILIIMAALNLGFSSQSTTTIANAERAIKSDYCKGWEEGYCEGWKDVKGQFAICPITPICPIPEVGLNKYKDGYNRAFKAGMKAAKK